MLFAYSPEVFLGLGRSPSTISREIHRNRHPWAGSTGRMPPSPADSRRLRPKTGKIASCPQLRDLVQDMPGRKCSPEQISRRLHRDFPDRPELHLTHGTIYQAFSTSRAVVNCVVN